jgi:hypothetical protein
MSMMSGPSPDAERISAGDCPAIRSGYDFSFHDGPHSGDQARRSSAEGQVLAVRQARRRGADARARRQGLAWLVASPAEGDEVANKLGFRAFAICFLGVGLFPSLRPVGARERSREPGRT